MSTPREFMERVVAWPGEEPGYVNIHTFRADKKDANGREPMFGRPFRDLDEAMNYAQYCASNPGKHSAVYYCTSTQSAVSTKGKFQSALRNRPNAKWLKAVWLEIDVGKKARRLPDLGRGPGCGHRLPAEAQHPRAQRHRAQRRRLPRLLDQQQADDPGRVAVSRRSAQGHGQGRRREGRPPVHRRPGAHPAGSRHVQLEVRPAAAGEAPAPGPRHRLRQHAPQGRYSPCNGGRGGVRQHPGLEAQPGVRLAG
jgi:hypothetical protein